MAVTKAVRPGADMPMPIRSVLMVCTGNICRSPAAEAVLRHQLESVGLAHVEVDSSGTGDWHAGERSHQRSRSVGEARGYVLDHRARVTSGDDQRFDLILAMDAGHLVWLTRRFHSHPGLRMFRSFEPGMAESRVSHLDDPYGHPVSVYEAMYDVIERTTPAIVERIRATHG